MYFNQYISCIKDSPKSKLYCQQRVLNAFNNLCAFCYINLWSFFSSRSSWLFSALTTCVVFLICSAFSENIYYNEGSQGMIIIILILILIMFMLNIIIIIAIQSPPPSYIYIKVHRLRTSPNLASPQPE